MTVVEKDPTRTKDPVLVDVSWHPITRIVGSLGIFTKIDFANRVVADCRSTSSIFRGYSIFMKGKDPRDAHFITSRICGICGDNHMVCATYAQNMAFGVRPPAMGEWIVNLGHGGRANAKGHVLCVGGAGGVVIATDAADPAGDEVRIAGILTLHEN